MASNTASTAKLADVIVAMDGGTSSTGAPFSALHDGDTLKIPAGVETWANPLNLTKILSVIGAGKDNTIITGGQIFAVTPNLVIGSPAPRPRLRISGMKWIHNKTGTMINMTGILPIDSSGGGGFRLDNIYFYGDTDTNSTGYLLVFGGWMEGVVDHCVLDFSIAPGLGEEIIINHPRSPDGTGKFGDYSWGQVMPDGDTLGIHKIWFEDCIIMRRGNIDTNQFDQSLAGGARYGARHCTSWHAIGGGHEGRSDGALRILGLRVAESYKNLFVRNVANRGGQHGAWANVRSGEGISWGNRYHEVGMNPAEIQTNAINVDCNQLGTWLSGSSWGGPDGTNHWDDNQRGPTLDGNGVSISPKVGYTHNASPNTAPYYTKTTDGVDFDPQKGDVYASGVGGSVGFQVLHPTWSNHVLTLNGMSGMTANKWQYFTVRNLRLPQVYDANSTNPVSFAFITSHGTDTFNIMTSNVVGTTGSAGWINAQFQIGPNDEWEIRKVKTCLQATGAGSGDTMANSTFNGAFGTATEPQLVSGTPVQRWTNQPAPGVSQWDNYFKTDMSAPSYTKVTAVTGGAAFGPAGGRNLRNTAAHPNYSYTPGTPAGSANPDTRVGADALVWAMAEGRVLTQDADASASVYQDGTGGNLAYPHPFLDTGARFTSAATATFSTNDVSRTFTVTTAGFTGTVTITRTGTAVPGLTFASTPGSNATATFTGIPTGANQTYTQHLTAHSTADGDVLQDLDIKVLNPDQPPDCSLTVSAGPYTAPATITLTATVSDDHGIASVGFYEGSNLINPPVITSPPYSTIWTGVAQGTYSLTAKATDTASPANVTPSSPAINITVTPAPAALAAPTIVVSASGPDPIPPPVSTTKKILHWQATNNNRVSVIQTNKTYIDTLPFDGLVVSTGSNQDLLGPTSVVNYTILSAEISPMNGLLTNVTHNYFVVMPGNSGMQDPFDSWTQTINNFVLIARVCKEQGLEGIFFDNEEYNIHWWTYNTDSKYRTPGGVTPSRTLAQYQAEWRQRGKDAMAAMIAEWPAIKIVHTLGPNRSVSAVPSDARFNGNPSWLGGYFFMGMFEQAPTGNHVISGGELYYNRTAANFTNWKNFFDTIYNQGNTALMPSTLNASWNANDNLSFGIFDADNTAINPVAPMTAALLQTTLVNAMPAADEFIWNYAESSGPEWLTSGGGSVGAWQNAVRAARATLGLPTL